MIKLITKFSLWGSIIFPIAFLMKWFGPFGQKHSHLKLSLSEPNSMIYDILFVLLWISGYITVRNKALSIHIILTIMIASILIMRSAAHLIIDELSYGDISLHIGVIAAAASLFFYAHYESKVFRRLNRLKNIKSNH
jgi:hypothetical protein